MVRRQLARVLLRSFEDGSLAGVVLDKGGKAVPSANAALLASQLSLQQRRGIVLPAQEESYDPDETRAPSGPAPRTHVDRVGAVSVIADHDEPVQEGIFQNRDGHRFEDGRYAAFTKVGIKQTASSTVCVSVHAVVVCVLYSDPGYLYCEPFRHPVLFSGCSPVNFLNEAKTLELLRRV